MDATRLHLADYVGIIVLPISRIIIVSAYKELRKTVCLCTATEYCSVLCFKGNVAIYKS